jgi:hypothetical protein
MDNQGSSLSLFDVEIDTYAQNHLNTISKWGRFISITGLIVLGLYVLLIITLGQTIIIAIRELLAGDTGMQAGVRSDEVSGIIWMLVAIVIIFILLGAAWCYFLLRASTLFKKGLITRNSNDISDGFTSLKNLFIVSIIITTIFILSTLYGMVNF